jgi:hypothetical protein
MRLSSSMGGDAADLTQPPATQDRAGVVHISRLRKQKIGERSNPNQEQTFKVPPEALAFFLGQQLNKLNHYDKCPAQEQMIKVSPEALAKISARPVSMWNYYENCQVQEQMNEKTPEAMPNFLLIAIHLNLPSISTEKSPRYSSVAADIIKRGTP